MLMFREFFLIFWDVIFSFETKRKFMLQLPMNIYKHKILHIHWGCSKLPKIHSHPSLGALVLTCNNGFGLSCTLLFPQCLGPCLACNQHSVDICWMNDSRTKWTYFIFGYAASLDFLVAYTSFISSLPAVWPSWLHLLLLQGTETQYV